MVDAGTTSATRGTDDATDDARAVPPEARDRWRETSDGSSRAGLWPRACGAAASRDDFAGHFRALVDLRGDEETHAAETSAQIEKDLPRAGEAFRRFLDLSDPNSRDRMSLKRVLLAFVSHAPEIGYVQSMHSMAAFLLLAGLDEEDAFWCLVTMTSEIVPGYFDEGMRGAKLDQRVFGRILRERLPALGLHLQALGPDDIVAAILSGQWLLTLFVNVLPIRATMEIWDEMFTRRHRAALFAATVALLESNATQVLETTEMGEAIELLQRCGESLHGDGGQGEDASDESKCDAFMTRVRELLDGELSPAKVDQLTARIRGRTRRPSDVKLPNAITSVSALTDVDDLCVGLVSDDLQDKMVAAKNERTSSDKTFEAELSELKKVSTGERERELTPTDAGTSCPEATLGATDVGLISENLALIEKQALALAEHGDEVFICVKQIVLRPIGAVAQSRLKSFCEEVLSLDEEFTETIQHLRGAIDKQLETHPDLSVFPSSNKYNKSMWSCWADSLFEGAIERAEMFLESLEQIRAELAWMVSMFVGERKDVAPKIPRAEGWEDIGEHSARDDVITPEPDEECLSTSSKSHKAETQKRLEEIRLMVKRTHEEAIQDVPRLKKNWTETTEKLKGELSAEEDAVNAWANVAIQRNEKKRKSVEQKLQGTVRELLASYGEIYPSVGSSSDAQGKDELEKSHSEEEKRLHNALKAVKALESVLTRRSNMLEREKQTGESVQAISKRTLSQTNAALLLVYEAGEWLGHELDNRSSPDFVANYEKIATLVEELSALSREICVRILRQWSLFVRKLTSQVVLEYVSTIDSAAQALSDTQATLAVSASRLDSNTALSSSPGTSREADSTHTSLRSLTSQMEKITDIAGSKLGKFGNRLRNFASPTAAKPPPAIHAPDASERSASVSPGNESNFAANMNSKTARLVALAREDDAKLERRRAQLLAKKTWLREHLLARGE